MGRRQANYHERVEAQEAAKALLPDVDLRKVRNGMIVLFVLGMALFAAGFWLLGQAGDEALAPALSSDHPERRSS